jgi:hypothetical protein
MIVIILLLTKGVRSLFWGMGAGQAAVVPLAAPQNP